MNSKGKCIITVIALFSIIFLSFSILCLPAFGDDGSKPKNPWEVWDYLGKPVKGGEYRVAAFKDVGLLNPHHWPINNWDVIDYLFDQYISSAEGNKMVPWMMESWEYLDNLTVVMKLKKGIVFHDGTAFNAGAVKYNVEWVMDKTNGCWDRSYFEPVDSVEILDDYTLKFKFKKSYGAFLAILSYPPGYALSVASLKGDLEVREFQRLERKLKLAKKKAAKLEKKAKKAASKDAAQGKKANAKFKKAKKTLTKLEKKFSEKSKKMKGIKSTDTFPVGSNAYMYDDRSPGNWIKLKRNPNWWYGKTVGKPDLPYFDSIKAIVIPDSSIQLANLKTGRIHQMKLSPFQYKLLRRSPHPAIKMGVINAAITTMLSFNHAKGPCKNILVRKAISHAIDRKALIHGALFGLARPASCLYPSDQGSHNPDLMPVSYDPEKSRALLKEAGYEDGLTIRGHFLNTPEYGTIVAAIKNNLSQVGINWDVVALDSVAIDGRRKNLEYDLETVRWPYIIDPDLPASGMYHPTGGFNPGRSHNAEAIKFIEAGREELDPEKRLKIYWKVEKALYENYEDVWLWYSRVAKGYHKSLMGIDAKMEERHLGTWSRSHSLGISMWFKNGDN